MTSMNEPECSRRKCKHFLGFEENEKTLEMIPTCAAYPDGDGIPDAIAWGSNLHLEPVDGDHGIQYEREADA